MTGSQVSVIDSWIVNKGLLNIGSHEKKYSKQVMSKATCHNLYLSTNTKFLVFSYHQLVYPYIGFF